MTDLSLQRFTDLDEAADVATYIAALEAFDAAEQIRELKAIERRRTELRPGSRVLDVGCGFGLETVRIAERVGVTGTTAGLDKSARFIAEAERRAAATNLSIDFRVGDAAALPYPAASFDLARAERVLIYLENWGQALMEMRRVVRPGGSISLIEPDFGSMNINLTDRRMVRTAIAFEADTAVEQSWLPGPLLSALRSCRLSKITIDTRVVVFPQDLAADYYGAVGQRAAAAGALSGSQLENWMQDLQRLRAAESLFGTIGYFLFTARVPA